MGKQGFGTISDNRRNRLNFRRDLFQHKDIHNIRGTEKEQTDRFSQTEKCGDKAGLQARTGEPFPNFWRRTRNEYYFP